MDVFWTNFWEGFNIGVIVALPFAILRLIFYFKKKNDINPFRIRRLFELLAICFGITFSFVKDEDFKK